MTITTGKDGALVMKLEQHEVNTLVKIIRFVATEQDGTLLGNEANQVLAGMGEL